ncbi:MAG: hypothetical protein HN768_04570, partial [Rhodospirillaceae bacterium]|nr:hypothetical protein [Rhodospirillaceae bacterium]
MTTPIRPPSVDQALKAPELSALIDTFGRKPVVD